MALLANLRLWAAKVSKTRAVPRTSRPDRGIARDIETATHGPLPFRPLPTPQDGARTVVAPQISSNTAIRQAARGIARDSGKIWGEIPQNPSNTTVESVERGIARILGSTIARQRTERMRIKEPEPTDRSGARKIRAIPRLSRCSAVSIAFFVRSRSEAALRAVGARQGWAGAGEEGSPTGVGPRGRNGDGSRPGRMPGPRATAKRGSCPARRRGRGC